MMWTDELHARLVKLAAEGHSSGALARMLSTEERPISRNAVLGRAYRCGIEVGGAVGKHAVVERVKPKRLPKAKGTMPVVPQRRAEEGPVVERKLAHVKGFNFTTSGLKPERGAGPVTVAPSKPRGLGLMDLQPGQCRFVLEMEPSPVFCAADVMTVRRKGREIDSSYCPHHHAVCHIKPEGKR